MKQPAFLMGWKYWVPAYGALAALSLILAPPHDPYAVHWSENAVFYASYPLMSFLIGYWTTAALTVGYKPLPRSLGGLCLGVAFKLFGLLSN